MYFIITLRCISKEIFYPRCWGFFANKEDCRKILHNNITDLHENYYNYAAIEKIDEGICSYPSEREFFKYDEKQGGFFEIEKPEWEKHCGILSFGG